jgi:hypothetical protein
LLLHSDRDGFHAAPARSPACEGRAQSSTRSPAGGKHRPRDARLIERLSPLLKQQFIIENRPGADDQYRVGVRDQGAAPTAPRCCMGGASNAINMSLFANPPYDTLRDFEPVDPLLQGCESCWPFTRRCRRGT